MCLSLVFLVAVVKRVWFSPLVGCFWFCLDMAGFSMGIILKKLKVLVWMELFEFFSSEKSSSQLGLAKILELWRGSS